MRLFSFAVVTVALGGCQFLTGVVPCRHGEPCPDGETCSQRLGVCSSGEPAADGGVDNNGAEGEGEGAGEGEGGEGEGVVGGEGEGEGGEGEGAAAGEGEGEGAAGGEGEGEGEGTISLPTSVCGNGALEAGEECDGGGRVSDGACNSTCHVESVVSETEPDDAPTQSGVKHLAVRAATILGSLRAASQSNPPDTDGFILSEPLGTVVRVQLYTKDAADDCGSGDEISLALFDGSGANFLREADDNADLGCPALTTAFDVAQLSFAMFEVNGQNISGYHLQIAALDERGAEREPNDDIGHAELAAIDGTDTTMSGTISRVDDVDFYAVAVPPGEGLRAEVVPAGSNIGCDAFNTQIALVDDAGVNLASRASVYAQCAFVDGTGASPRDAAAQNTSAETKLFFVAVAKGSSGFAGTLPYHVAFTVR